MASIGPNSTLVSLLGSRSVRIPCICMWPLNGVKDPYTNMSRHPSLLASLAMQPLPRQRMVIVPCGRWFGADCEGLLTGLKQPVLTSGYFEFNACRFYASAWLKQGGWLKTKVVLPSIMQRIFGWETNFRSNIVSSNPFRRLIDIRGLDVLPRGRGSRSSCLCTVPGPYYTGTTVQYQECQ